MGKKLSQAEGATLAADNFFENTLIFLDPHAADVLCEESNMRAVRNWLLKRLLDVGFDISKDHTVYPSVNTWNQNGYGLQSVSVRVIDENSNAKLKPGEWLDPTIGIIAPGMLDSEGEYGIANFDIELGKKERCTALSPQGIMLQAVPAGQDSSVEPEHLKAGQVTEAAGPGQVMRAIIELVKDSRGPRQRVKAVLRNGIYACEFLVAD